VGVRAGAVAVAIRSGNDVENSRDKGLPNLNLGTFFENELAEHAAAVAAAREVLREPFGCLVDVSAEVIESGGKILLFGNGGSAADAQHIATEMTVRYCQDRRAMAALALGTDTSALTAAGNDFGFEFIFARQIEALGRPGDLAIGLTTSGRSPNVLRALEAARSRGLLAAALSGKGGGDLAGIADPLLIVPDGDTARIQEIHITLGHMLCRALEMRLGLV